MLSGLNLTVYTATIGGTINTVETLGVFTSKVAELQVVSVDGSNFGLGSLGAGVGLLLTLLLLLLLLVVRVRVRSASSSEENSPVEVRPVVRKTEDEVAYTVYDKVDLLLPAQYSDSSLETTATSATTGSLCQSARSQHSHSQCLGQGETHRESIL